ncbi:filensin [Trichomycterus rosablanca]|uniref:filensin n=1 Tax=Trichomycterus rosablanca TaxID=2290929 RepID=UPI002F353A0D
MFKTSYRHEVRKEKYESSNVFEELSDPEPEAPFYRSTMVPGWESLQELNSRFARYINRARVLEQRNAVFRKQLETLQHMEETAGHEEVFSEQITTNQHRIRELLAERLKLEQELKDAEGMLEDFSVRYRNECEYQEQLRGKLEQLNKEADTALLRNLEHQIESQFLQDDINSTRDRHKKNLAEIQTYVNILHQINQTVLMPNMFVEISEEQERMISQRRVPALQSQLEEYKSALCQLQAQKHKLQTETSALEQNIKNTQECYDDEIQRYNDQIESQRKSIEEAERLLEKYINDCRQLAIYQTSLENELERNKRIIENEDNRLNSAIIGSPVSLFTSQHRSHICSPTVTSRGKDITQAIQDITNVKPRQKNLAKKANKKEELFPRDILDSIRGKKEADEHREDEKREVKDKEEVNMESKASQCKPAPQTDVPDGAQISKAFDTLCNLVRNRLRRYRKPEPIADFFTKGSYVLVTGESSYLDPCFCTTTPSAGHIFVTICDKNGRPHNGKTPSPPPSPSDDSQREKEDDEVAGKSNGDNMKGGKHKRNGDAGRHSPGPKSGQNNVKDKTKDDKNWQSTSSSDIPPNSMRYEKLEVVESVEKLSSDNKLKGFEETSVVVETMIEKTSKKK